MKNISQNGTQIKVVAKQSDIPYKCLEKLGEGSFADVFIAQNIHDGRKYAIKKIGLSPFYQGEQGEICKEIQRLKSLKGDHIIEYFDSYLIDNEIWIIMRKCSGSLRDMMESREQFTAKQIISILVQITNAMKVLNINHTMHLDLKPENVLFLSNMDMRLSDFGCAQMANKGSFSKVSFVDCAFGTYLYISPQIKLGQNTGYRASQDVWSLGVIIYELLYRKLPVPDPESEMRLLWDQKKFIKFPRVSEDKNGIRNLLKDLLQINPSRRPTWSQVQKRIINTLNIHEVEFCSVREAFERYNSTTQMFILILRQIQQNSYGHCQDFWQKYSSNLVETIMCLVYLYSKKFRQIFGFKMNEKISNKDMKDFLFWEDNSKIQVKKYFRNKENLLPNLKDLMAYEDKMDKILTQMKEELNKTKKQWKSLHKIAIFCKEADEMPQPDFFCCSRMFPETLKVFSN